MQHDLTHLLDPVPLDHFLDEHWERKPLVVKRNQPEWFGGLFQPDDFERILLAPVSAVAMNGRQGSIAATTTIDGDHVEIPLNVDGRGHVTLSSVYRALDTGHTVCLRHLRRVSEPLANLCALAEEALQQPTGCNVFVTPSDTHGYTPHYDTADTFFLQISGTKRWVIHEPEFDLAWGREIGRVDVDTLPEPYLDVVLEPGDTLYLPRGWIHGGSCGSEPSMHITLGAVVLTWVQLAHRAIEVAAQHDRRLRETLPLRTGDHAAIAERMALLLAGLPPIGQEALEQLLVDRLADLPTQLVGGRVREVLAPPPITDETLVRRRAGLAPVVRVDDSTATLHFVGSKVSGPRESEDALRFVAATPEFFAGQLPLHPDARSQLIRQLHIEGFIDIVQSTIDPAGDVIHNDRAVAH